MSAVSGLSSASAAGAAMLPPAATPDLNKGRKAAREFEAQLISTVLESFEKTFATLPGQDEIAGEDNYNYMGTEAMASALAEGGGFGIAQMISVHLTARKEVGANQDTPAAIPGSPPKVFISYADGTTCKSKGYSGAG
jgi:Rod binding domain-containing protein